MSHLEEEASEKTQGSLEKVYFLAGLRNTTVPLWKRWRLRSGRFKDLCSVLPQ